MEPEHSPQGEDSVLVLKTHLTCSSKNKTQEDTRETKFTFVGSLIQCMFGTWSTHTNAGTQDLRISQ